MPRVGLGHWRVWEVEFGQRGGGDAGAVQPEHDPAADVGVPPLVNRGTLLA